MADLGCGCGVLSLGAVMMGAAFVHGFDIDQDALAVFQTNLEGEKRSHYCHVGFRLYHNTVYIEDFEMDNVDLLNIDVGALGPDWKSRSYSSQKSDLIYIFHTCPLPIWVSFCRTGKTPVSCPFFLKSRAFVLQNLTQ